MGRLGAGGRAALSEKALEKEGGNVIAEGVDMVRLGRGESGTDREFRQEEEDIVVLDAGGSVEEVAEQAWKIVEARVAAVERGEVGTVVRRVS